MFVIVIREKSGGDGTSFLPSLRRASPPASGFLPAQPQARVVDVAVGDTPALGLGFPLGSCSTRKRRSSSKRAYLPAVLAFGAGNIANDAWLEQVVERGWSSYPIPSVLGFTANWLWLCVLLTALAIWTFWFRFSPQPRSSARGT